MKKRVVIIKKKPVYPWRGTQSPPRIHCPKHGNVQLTWEEFDRQMKLYLKAFICPLDRIPRPICRLVD